MSTRNLSIEAEQLLGALRSKSQSNEEKEKLMYAINALHFIFTAGQSYDFEDYLSNLAANAPPLAIASFATREEAEAWLAAHRNPPDQASVLINGSYYVVAYVRKINYRALRRSIDLECYLGDMVRKGVPPPVATFNTREEAEAWVHAQPEPPRQVFIHVGGEAYLAAYHEKFNLRVLYPVSIAKFANYTVSDEPT